LQKPESSTRATKPGMAYIVKITIDVGKLSRGRSRQMFKLKAVSHF